MDFALLIIYGQTIRLTEQSKQPLHLAKDEDFIQLVTEKIATVCDVKTVKIVYLEKTYH